MTLCTSPSRPTTAAGELIDVLQVQPQHQRVLVEAPSNAKCRSPIFGRIRVFVSSASNRIALVGDQRLEHRPGRLAEHVRDDRVQLDPGVLQQPLDALGLPGTFLDEFLAVSGQVPQLLDRPGWDEAATQHAAVQQPANYFDGWGVAHLTFGLTPM